MLSVGIGNFLAEISSSESEEYQTRDPGYEPTQSVKDYSQPLYCKICHIQCNSDSFVALVSLIQPYHRCVAFHPPKQNCFSLLHK